MELTLNMLEKHYPIIKYYKYSSDGKWEKSLAVKIKGYLLIAKLGNIHFENELMNIIGTLHRNRPYFKYLSIELLNLIDDCIDYFKSVGRKVNFNNANPAEWITTRSGLARW